MKQIFIIILDPSADSSLLRAKIHELGDYYIVYNDQYLVYADYEDAKQLYEKLVPSESVPTGIVIFSVSVEYLKYWGYSDKGLWSWLGSHVPL